ncbi:MAG: MATE family efflux transporter [Lachnospiraceae bacterium]|nr:MATE family efflux transporter [Lachnospiraceae bacterium]
MKHAITKKTTTTRNMTTGPILVHMIMFALPLMVGNIFQLLYNTVDTWVVGNFVSTEALAAVGSTTMIINIMVFFFNGLSVGCGVVISRHFGAGDQEKLHKSIETTMALTFLLSALFTVIGVLWVRPMLIFMSTPAEVIPDATVYLRIYFAGISGLLIYNMGSGILRAVGDTTRPLYFLVITSVLNIILDLFFVLVLGHGIDGVAYATIISQLISAVLVVTLLSRTQDIYRLTWNDLRIDKRILAAILAVGLPTAVQSTITSFSNVFVQSYVNYFGSAVMAGWSCYNKLDQFVFLPMNSLASAATTFVSQNVGAKDEKRATKGTWEVIGLTVIITGIIAVSLIIFAVPASAIFTNDNEVIRYGALFLRLSSPFIVFNCINHTLAGALRGRGDSKAPMYIMLGCFVVLRQIYLYVGTHFFVNNVYLIGLAYPVGWTMCCIIEVIYYFVKWNRKN